MSFLDTLREARQNPLVAYQQFVLQYHRTLNDIHAFMEGRDDPAFYLTFLRRVAQNPNEIHVYRCNNKNGVYEAYSKVMHLVKDGSYVLFFVDKDHSDLIGEHYEAAPNIYVTDFYSIENYLVTEEMLLRIWEDFLNPVNIQVDYPTIASKFRDELDRFYSFALPLSAWLILTRRRGLKPNANNVKPSEIFKFSEDLTLNVIPLSDLLLYLERVCGIPPQSDLSTELSSAISELESLDPKKYIRGKYGMCQ